MNSRSPMSEFDRPSRASRATWISWAVSCSRVSIRRLRTRSPVASSSRSVRAANAGAHAREQLEGGAQVVAGVEAAPLAPQPLAIEQVGPRELQTHAGAAQPLDRLPVEALGG